MGQGVRLAIRGLVPVDCRRCVPASQEGNRAKIARRAFQLCETIEPGRPILSIEIDSDADNMASKHTGPSGRTYGPRRLPDNCHLDLGTGTGRRLLRAERQSRQPECQSCGDRLLQDVPACWLFHRSLSIRMVTPNPHAKDTVPLAGRREIVFPRIRHTIQTLSWIMPYNSPIQPP